MPELGEGLSGYLDVENATLRAPRLEAVSNIGIANTAPRHAFSVGSNLYVSTESSNVLTVNGNVACEGIKMGLIEITPSYDLAAVSNVGNVTSNTIQFSNATTGFVTTANVEVGGELTVSGNVTVSENLTVSGLPMATVASNLVTYDKTTGKLFDSAGLFSNKLAVVSVQPPEALTGASTVVTGHGTYTIESPGVDAYKLFDKDDSTTWTGDNVTVTLPYKTTLRYLKMLADTLSGTVTVEASHTDGLTWTTLVSGATTAETVLVNATQPYKKYKFSFGSSITLKTLDLFTESFSIDGGKVAMAQQPTMGGETTMDQHGPHGRGPGGLTTSPSLKKYPEIVFGADSTKLRGNDSTNTYTQESYTVTASSYENQEAILRSKGLTGPQGYTMSTAHPDLLTNNANQGISGMQSTAQGSASPRGDGAAIPSGSNPKTSGTLTPTGSRFYWSDLGRDICDEWGRWYIYNPTDQTASHIQFGTLNGPIGTVFTEKQYHVGKTFTIKHGWVALGIFKLDVECEDPTFSFSIGMYGDMGSDSTTGNEDKQYTAPWGTLHYNFNRTNSGSLINTDPFYTHLIPKQRSFNDAIGLSGTNFTSKLKTVTSSTEFSGALAIWFDTLQVGATMYFVVGASGTFGSSAAVDWVANDISGEANPWKVFDEITPKSSWASKSGTYYDGTSPANSYTGTTHQLGPGVVYGEWLKLKLSHRIKLTKFILYADDINEAPKSYKIYGSVTGSSWAELKDVSNETPSIYGNSHEITDTESYRYIAVVVTQVNTDQDNVRIGEIKLYGYEYFGAGDTSIDTTFTSIMNTPQTTGAQVYVDGNLGETFTNRVVGPTVSNTHTTYVSAEKYWELTGALTSNVTLEANTFLSGDAPHSLSMWFNSSNLEANVSNSCIFSLGTEEKLDHMGVGAYQLLSNNYQTVHKLLSSDLEAGDRFGYAMSMNSDGTKFIVGAFEEHAGGLSDAGAAYIYTYNGSSWFEQKLVSPDNEASAKFGVSVSMSSDGTRVIVGAPRDDEGASDTGAAYIFTYSGGSWDTGTKIVAPDKAVSDMFGYSAAMSGDGNMVIVGAYIEDDNVAGGAPLPSAGSAYIYTYDGSNWDTGTKIVASDRTASDIFGRSVAINSDGTKVIVGADGGRAAYIFTYNSGTNNWDQQQILVASGGATSDRFGYAVAMNSNGTTVIVGAYAEDVGGTNETGAAYIYTYDGSNWDTGTKIVASDKEAGDRFGVGVEMNSDGTKVIVAAYQEHAGGIDNAGAAYIFAYDGSNWDTGLKITAPDKAASDAFSSDKQGAAMSGDGARVIVGAYGVDPGGAAYIFDRDTFGHPGSPAKLKLQSNTWHNLTYAYQGEGGSKVTYLDGRKVAEDKAEDTFGEYPPFAMTGHSQGGYVVSSSSFNPAQEPYRAFDSSGAGGGSVTWTTAVTTNLYGGGDGLYGTVQSSNLGLDSGGASTPQGGTHQNGEWIRLEMPHKLKLSYISISRINDDTTASPEDFQLYGSNNGKTWVQILSETGANPSTTGTPYTPSSTPVAYKYFGLVVTRTTGRTNYMTINDLVFYGHRENDLVRLPDPTNVLKYPHIAMTGQPGTNNGVNDLTHAQRGYVVSASSMYIDNSSNPYQPWRAFDNKYTEPGGTESFWNSTGLNNTYGGGSGAYGTVRTANLGLDSGGMSTPQGGTRENGEWLKIQLPNKIVLSHIELVGHSDTTANPKSFKIYGSINGTVWVEVLSVSNTGRQSRVGTTFTPGSTPDAYNYFGLVVTATQSRTGYVIVTELKLYGTEEATSIPLQIGGGNIDKVANFRVYDKFIGEDQALEIWDAQKDEFGRAKSSMTLQKGRLGIGTTEPQGRLAVLDEPHNLEEFPPRAMTDNYKNYFEGHGEFCINASSYRTASWSNGLMDMFDKNNATFVHNSNGSAAHEYSTSDGTYTGTASLAGYSGEWFTIKLPYNILIDHFTLSSRGPTGRFSQSPKSFTFIASKDNGVTWTELATYTDENVYWSPASTLMMSTTRYYNFFGLIVHSNRGVTIDGASEGNDALTISEWRLFGTREQGQSVLHDGQLTLTKNLDVPRIGPDLDADDTPRRDRLVVEYNTSTNPTFEGAVRDTSGRGNDAVFISTTHYDATEKALKFNGSSDRMEVYIRNQPGAWIHTFSFWVKPTETSTGETILQLGNHSASDNSSLRIENGTIFRWFFHTNDITWTNPLIVGSWYHVVAAYDGGSVAGSRKLWVNGIEIAQAGNQTPAALTLPENAKLSIGGQTGYNFLGGSISNFKLYDTALTPEEVKTLYDMGRCDEGHHVVNFSKTRVGIGLGDGEAPTYTLDVRGQIRSDGSLVTSFTGQHKCIPEEPMEKGLIVSAKKNQFVKLNGFAIGKSAITIDESLPIVSLSNVAQDKACFGVVSSTEEANTTFRVETTNGGVISTIPKTLGDNRAIVNSVGEGAVWVVDTGGSLESGDYITTSNVVGYGQKQTDDVLHNYTVAKITMDCDFTGSNVAVQTIKREETGTRTITEDAWNQLVDYDRSSNTETQYSNTLAPSAYSDQLGYVPREVTTIVDYTDGSNIVSIAEWSNLESNIQNTYQSNTFTEIMDYTKFVNLSEWSNLTPETQNTFSEAEITTYYQIQRGENVLDENGQLQFEDKTGATEAPYERRFLDASGAQTDEANAVHIAAFVGCTYHCG